MRLGLGLLVLLALVTAGVWYAAWRQINRVYHITGATMAVPHDDPQQLARGEHLVRSRGCAECHGSDLGGRVMVDNRMVGRIVASNLTRGRGGIGGFAPADFDRAIRYGVGRDGRSLILMPSEDYSELSDDDLAAIIAYLRSVPAVDRELPASALAFPVSARGVLRGDNPLLSATRIRPNAPHLDLPMAETAAYGEYVAGACRGCHGANFAGGRVASGPPDWPPASNLTPAGPLRHWTREQFVTALRSGHTPDGRALDPRAMPWRALGQMSDVELHALWLYLQSLPPVPSAT
jgi:mono/diheme cytochrome c family protein